MLRMYFVAQFYNLADKTLEDIVYDSQTLHYFIGVAPRKKTNKNTFSYQVT